MSHHDYNDNFRIEEFNYLVQNAITVKILPSGDIPGETENEEYALSTVMCSNPIYALNRGYEMTYRYQVDQATANPIVIGYADEVNWKGTTQSLARIENSCFVKTANGSVPQALSDSIYHACGNAQGMVFITLYHNECWLRIENL